MPQEPSAGNIASHLLGCVRDAFDALEGDSRQALLSFVSGLQNPDGGFRGRHGSSDLYYTLFALILLHTCGGEYDRVCLNQFLNRYSDSLSLNFIDHACLLRCLLRCDSQSPYLPQLVKSMERFRSVDGGYAPEEMATVTTAYAPFVVYTAYQECGQMPADFFRVAQAVEQLIQPDGGYANDTAIVGGAVTVTSAAMVVLHSLTGRVNADSVSFLMRHALPGGGFKAIEYAPCADLLSTATALYALKFCGAPLAMLREDSLAFIESLWCDKGGFYAYEADTVLDVEYTFYGLLALGSILL